MTPAEYLEFLAPELADVPEGDRATALTIAESYRPRLSDAEKQSEGVALYAAHLLTLRRQSTTGSGVSALLKAEQAGDTRFEYAVPTWATDGGTSYYARWSALYNRPAVGVILTGAKLVPR